MAKTGLISRILYRAVRDWESYHQKETTPETLAYHDGLEKTLALLKEVGKSASPELVLAVEKH